MVYVRPEYHDRIMRITRVIGHGRLSLSAYIDHVLTHHFDQCEGCDKEPLRPELQFSVLTIKTTDMKTKRKIIVPS